MRGERYTAGGVEMVRSPVVAVVGGSVVGPEVAEQAYVVGRELASGGAAVVCGGLGGVMEAASRGASEAGGMVVGVLPGTDTRSGNEHLAFAVASGMGRGRNTVIALTCDAMVAIDGSYGTLSEVAQALNHGRPVVALGSWDLEAAGNVDPKLFRTASTPEEAARTALALVGLP